MTHWHRCEICGETWDCDARLKKPMEQCNIRNCQEYTDAECPGTNGPCIMQKPECEYEIEKAAKVNGSGPYCPLCYHVEMAKRFAAARGTTLEQWLKEKHK